MKDTPQKFEDLPLRDRIRFVFGDSRESLTPQVVARTVIGGYDALAKLNRITYFAKSIGNYDSEVELLRATGFATLQVLEKKREKEQEKFAQTLSTAQRLVTEDLSFLYKFSKGTETSSFPDSQTLLSIYQNDPTFLTEEQANILRGHINLKKITRGGKMNTQH